MTALSDKFALRRAARAVRRAVVGPENRAVAAAKAFFADARRPSTAVAAVYIAAGFEIDAAPLACRLLQAGSLVVLPVVVAPDAPLAFTPCGGGSCERDPDLVLTPLLAFDRWGGRLGQGGGFYDRTLAELRVRGRVVALGLAFDAQEIDEVPIEAHDVRLDGVLTETGLRFFPPSRES